MKPGTRIYIYDPDYKQDPRSKKWIGGRAYGTVLSSRKGVAKIKYDETEYWPEMTVNENIEDMAPWFSPAYRVYSNDRTIRYPPKK